MRYGPDGLNEDQQLRADIAAYLKSQEPTPDGLAEEALNRLEAVRNAFEELLDIASEECLHSAYAKGQLSAIMESINALEGYYGNILSNYSSDFYY